MGNKFYSNSDPVQRFQPGTTVRADAVDAKFDNIANAFDQVQSDLESSLKIRADGATFEISATATQRRTKVVGFDRDGDMALLSGFVWRGNFSPGEEYFVNDVIRDTDTKNLYVVEKRHVSGSSINLADVSLAIDVSDIEQARDQAQASAEKAQSSESSAMDAAENAATAATEATQSASTASESLSDLEHRYLGPKSEPPTHTSTGDPVSNGALYWNTVDTTFYLYTGGEWVAASAFDVNGVLLAKENLSDLDSVVAARSNLGLGTAATTDSSSYATSAQGEKADTALQSAADLSDVSSKPKARSNLGLGSAATRNSSDFATGEEGNLARSALQSRNNLDDVYSTSISRQNLGLGSAATRSASDFATAAQGNAADSAVQPSDLARVATTGKYSSLTDTVNTIGSYEMKINGGAAGQVVELNGAGGFQPGQILTPAGQPTFDRATFIGTSSVKLPHGTTGQRENPHIGSIRYNSDISAFEGYNGSSWGTILQTEENGDLNTEIGHMSAKSVYAGEFRSGSEIEWNSSSDSYSRPAAFSDHVTSVHKGMKRCLLDENGQVNYYLDPDDSTKKEDGSSSDLSGAHGMVMVEIPKFYFRFDYNGRERSWKVSDLPLAGYELHPAFYKNGRVVDYRYVGAYDACVFSYSSKAFISGTNLDDNTSNIDFDSDHLASVSGIYPMVGLTRNQFRTLASNLGVGWRLQDFWVTSAIQMLYLSEYGDFNSQANLGSGNVNGSYVSSSDVQSDSPSTVAGASNGWGNQSTDGSQPSSGAKPGVAYMSYRGVENFYGNCWDFVDGLNVSVGDIGTWYVCNNDNDFADNTSSGYNLIATSMPSDGYVTDITNTAGSFIPRSTGGSSSTYLADYFYDDNGNTNRVALFGGSAYSGGWAGAFYWYVTGSSSYCTRGIGSRLSF
ncbi:hypothetical protein [Spiribacter onubensis]|uniref:Tail fiber protein n=1 Tax=Spiribacter onubensis TaxID=3122420 RepID=A0ABV3S6W5_9GAMM